MKCVACAPRICVAAVASPYTPPVFYVWWLGAAPTTSPLHYDNNGNIVLILRRTKRITLLPPDDLELERGKEDGT